MPVGLHAERIVKELKDAELALSRGR